MNVSRLEFRGLPGMAAAVLLALSMPAMAAPIVFDRGLPTANLNDAAGANRSNVAWGYGANAPTYYTGDDFQLGGGSWRIDTIRTWAAFGPAANTSPSLLADRYSSITLYGGSGPNLTALMSGATVGNGTNNANISVTRVQYAGGADYESFGNQLGLYEITFTNLNWIVDGSTQQFFSVAGLDNPAEAAYRPWFMHASNAALGGAAAQGADNRYGAFFDNGVGGLAFDGLQNSQGDGWDKSSDINVQIEAVAIPEPATLALVGAALLGVAVTGRRRAARSSPAAGSRSSDPR